MGQVCAGRGARRITAGIQLRRHETTVRRDIAPDCSDCSIWIVLSGEQDALASLMLHETHIVFARNSRYVFFALRTQVMRAWLARN